MSRSQVHAQEEKAMSERTGPVVVGYDGSAHAEQAVDWAALEASRRGRDLVVLFAADLAALSHPEVTMGQFGDQFAEVSEAVVAAGVARARAAAPGLDVEPTTTPRGAAAALEEASVRASLIVVGGRGKGRLAEALHGTVPSAITAHAECDVVVVPPDSEAAVADAHPVVVGVDGSAGSDRALRAAAALALDLGARLVVVCAWERTAVEEWNRVFVIHEGWRDALFAAARARADQAMEQAVAILDQEYPGLTVRRAVTEGRPSTVLTRLSARAGLVVVGARGGGDLTSLLLGSVGRNLLHASECPVAVIR